MQSVIIPPEGLLELPGFTRYFWETIWFLSSIFCLVWPESECYISFKQIQAKMRESAPFTLKLWIQNQTEALSEVGDFKKTDSPLKEERRNDRNTGTRCEQATTKSGRFDQRCCRVVWLLFNEPSGSFQSKCESLLSGSEHFKNKGSLLSSCVHKMRLYCTWAQSSWCSPYDNNHGPLCKHETHTWALTDIV